MSNKELRKQLQFENEIYKKLIEKNEELINLDYEFENVCNKKREYYERMQLAESKNNAKES